MSLGMGVTIFVCFIVREIVFSLIVVLMGMTGGLCFP